MPIFKKIGITLLMLLFLSTGKSQKVALVLSGGGSKGAAHIGVIRALEDAGIPIDFIAGTSAGAIVGGLYCAGYSTDEIEAIFLSPQFKNWSTGEIEEEYQFYFKKEKANPSWLTIKFDWDSILSPKIPINLISPYQMDFAFLEMFAGANTLANGNFDSLFIPFRCVATNLKTNKGEVQRSGNIGEAIRASMTFPFFFRPITINGNIMYDGGMRNNFPADVAEDDFNPDIIIGSKVATTNKTPHSSDIMSIIENMLMENNDYKIKCSNGILIEPKVEEVMVTDLSKTPEFINNGYIATLEKIPQIKQFVVDSIPLWDLKLRRHTYKKRLPPLTISSIKVDGLNTSQSDYINKLLTNNSDSSSIKDVKAAYFKLISDDKVAYIYPRLIFNPETKKYDMLLDVEKDKNFELLFGGNISSNAINTIYTELRYKQLGIQGLNIFGNIYLGRFYSSAVAAIKMDYPQRNPFYQEILLGFNQFNFSNTSRSFFGDETPSFLKQNENFFNYNIGFPSTNKAKWEIGITFAGLKDNYYQTNTFTRLDQFDINNFDMIKPYINYELNTHKRQYYSNQGVYLFASLFLINGKERNIPGTTGVHNLEVSKSHNWIGLRIKYTNFIPYNKHFTFGIQSDISLSNQDLFATYTASKLRAPQFSPTPEITTQFLPTFRDYNFVTFGFKTIYKITDRIDIRLDGHLYQPIQSIKKGVDESPKFTPFFQSQYIIASATGVYNSPVGPLSLSVYYIQNSPQPFLFNLNFGYIIFNKRTML